MTPIYYISKTSLKHHFLAFFLAERILKLFPDSQNILQTDDFVLEFLLKNRLWDHAVAHNVQKFFRKFLLFFLEKNVETSLVYNGFYELVRSEETPLLFLDLAALPDYVFLYDDYPIRGKILPKSFK